MSFSTKSDLANNDNEGIYGNSKVQNDDIILNFHENNHYESKNEFKTTVLNETETNLQHSFIYSNKIYQNSEMIKSNNIFCDVNLRDNSYPFSDNLRKQLNNNDKYLKPKNNININNEDNFLQNNIQQNCSVIQKKIDNKNPNFNGIVDNNINNDFRNNQKQNEIEYDKKEKEIFNCKKYCKKVCKILGVVVLIILVAPLLIFLIYSLVVGGCPSGCYCDGCQGDMCDCNCDCNSECNCDCCKCKKKKNKIKINKNPN